MTSNPGAQTIRLRIELAYDGTFFRGWATQPGLRTCQGELETALETIARTPVVTSVAGRTDAGVHAAHQVVHCDFPLATWTKLLREPTSPPTSLLQAALSRRLNALLARQYGQWMAQHSITVPKGGSDLVVHSVEVVTNEFDARFSALGRRYTYRVGTGSPNPLRRQDVYWIGESLNIETINKAAHALLGEHDFLSYCKPREGATTIRTLTTLEATLKEDQIIEFHVAADAFCHSMVRSLVGALLRVGLGGDVGEPERLLLSPSRQWAAPIAPAHGLTLEGVDYPAPEQWGAQSRLARRRRDEDTCCGE